MAIAVYGMADHQVALYEKKDTEMDDSGVCFSVCWIFHFSHHINSY